MSAKDGKPHAKCGTNEWYKDGRCAFCTRAKSRRYREANPEKVRESARRYRCANTEKERARRSRYYQANKEKEREYNSKWWRDNKDRARELSRKRREAHPEQNRENSRIYRRRHPDKVKERNQEWYQANKDRSRENGRRWRAENPESKRMSDQRWAKANPDKMSAQYHRRRARLKGGGGSHTPAEWREICKQYGNRCLRCGRDDVKLTKDHVLPITMGGADSADNLQPLCKSCNSWKNDRHIDYRNRGIIMRWIQGKLLG